MSSVPCQQVTANHQPPTASEVVLISGKEEILRRNFLANLIAEATNPDDFDFETFYADERPASHWIAAASTAPFLSPRRTVVVRRLLRAGTPMEAGIKDENPLQALPPTALLILVADDESGDSARQQRLATICSAWEKLVSGHGTVHKCDVSDKNLAVLIRDAAKDLGKSISGPAADLLIEMTGQSYSRALGELEKVALYLGDIQEIREQVIRAVVTPSREWNVFKMINAVIAGQPPTAIRQLRIVIGTMKPEEAALRNIFPTMVKQFRLIWQARLCIDARCVPANAPLQVAGQFSRSPNLLKEKEWSQNRAMQAARHIPLHRLSEALEIIAETDARLKGLLPAYTAFETLEQMLLQLVDIMGSASPTTNR